MNQNHEQSNQDTSVNEVSDLEINNPILVEASSPKIELENITDAVHRLTLGFGDPSNPWLRRKTFSFPMGLDVVYAFTVDRPDGPDYTAIVENQPERGRNITRKWNHKDASDETSQVVEIRLKDGTRWNLSETRKGFQRKDLNRMNKLIKDSLEHLESDG